MYEECYPFGNEIADDTSLSKLFLRYPPSINISDFKYLFDPNDSRANKLVTLITVAGKTYGYHLLYMTLREDTKNIPSRKDSVRRLEEKGNTCTFIHYDQLGHKRR